MRLLTSLLIGLLFSMNAFASGHDQGGGGVVFMCKNGKSARPYLADTFQLLHSSKNSAAAMRLKKKMKELQSEEEVFAALLGSIGVTDTIFANKLIDGYHSLRFEPVQSLELWGDDDIFKIPADCEKAQLAVQHFATNTVEYNEALYGQLSKIEQAFFRLHEAYVKIYHVNSKEVRTHVEKIATHSAFESLLNRISGKDPGEFDRLLKLYETSKTVPDIGNLVGVTAGICYNNPALFKVPGYDAYFKQKTGHSLAAPAGTWLFGYRGDDAGIHTGLFQSKPEISVDRYFSPQAFKQNRDRADSNIQFHNESWALELKDNALVSRLFSRAEGQTGFLRGELKIREADGKIIVIETMDPGPTSAISGLISVCFWFRKIQ